MPRWAVFFMDQWFKMFWKSAVKSVFRTRNAKITSVFASAWAARFCPRDETNRSPPGQSHHPGQATTLRVSPPPLPSATRPFKPINCGGRGVRKNPTASKIRTTTTCFPRGLHNDTWRNRQPAKGEKIAPSPGLLWRVAVRVAPSGAATLSTLRRCCFLRVLANSFVFTYFQNFINNTSLGPWHYERLPTKHTKTIGGKNPDRVRRGSRCVNIFANNTVTQKTNCHEWTATKLDSLIDSHRSGWPIKTGSELVRIDPRRDFCVSRSSELPSTALLQRMQQSVTLRVSQTVNYLRHF